MTDKLNLKKELVCYDCGELIRKTDTTKIIEIEGKHRTLHTECAAIVLGEAVRGQGPMVDPAEPDTPDAAPAPYRPPPDNGHSARHAPKALAGFEDELSEWVRSQRRAGKILI